MSYYDHTNNPREYENDENFDYRQLSKHLRDCIADLEEGYVRKTVQIDCLWQNVYAGINSACINEGVLTEEEGNYLYNKHLLGN